MNCECCVKKITKYINREFSIDEKKEELEFIRHMEQCPVCFEELELSFIMLKGLDMLDEGQFTSFDFTAELKKDMENRKRAIIGRKRRLNLIFWGSVLIFMISVGLLLTILIPLLKNI